MKKLLFILLVLLIFPFSKFTFSQTPPCCDFYNSGQEPGIEGETFGVSLGDIDNDGDIDAVVVDAYDDMEVYVNDGSGNFTFDEVYGSGESWFGVYLVDIDNDNDPDIVVAAFYSGNGTEVWKNNGSGDFTVSQNNIATSIGVEELAIGDVNGDGYPDIFVPSSQGSHSEVWLNDGTGSFNNSNQALDGSSCTQAVLADLDGDSDLDAFVSRTNGSPNKVWINDGNGNYTESGQELGNAFSTGVDAADIDGDGDIDVITSNWQQPSRIWINDGNANFSEGPAINNDNYAKSVVLEDIDYDYDYDIIIGSYGSPGLQVWSNDGAGTFTLCYENDGSVYAHDVAVGDMNNDLMPDIWVGNFSSSNGDQIFFNETPELIYDTLYLCDGDSIFLAGQWLFDEGDFLQSINCDTLAWYHISKVIIDTTLTLNFDTLFALPGYTGYRWIDCETMEIIPGANDYFYVSEQMIGWYAVEITSESCIDTSDCHWVILEGMNNKTANGFSVSPNPAKSFIRINNPFNESCTISIIDLTGQEILQQYSSDKVIELDISTINSGVYLLKIKSKNQNYIRKLVKVQ